MATAASHSPPPRPLDLDITIVSAKHLKNVNWRNGDLNPYAIFWIDPDRRFATKSDDSNSTKPVWNERFIIPLSSSPAAAVLTVEIFHSKPSDTPKPFVGAVRIPIGDLPNVEDSTVIRTIDLRRPSGRPNGKLRLKLALREGPLPYYQNAPQAAYYYATAIPPPPVAPSPPPPPHTYHYGSYSDPYSGYYRGEYYSPPPPPPRPYVYGGGGGATATAPVDHFRYERARETRKVPYGAGLGTGLAVGALSGGLAGLAIDEGLRYEEEKSMRRVASDISARSFDDYSDYRRMDY